MQFSGHQQHHWRRQQSVSCLKLWWIKSSLASEFCKIYQWRCSLFMLVQWGCWLSQPICPLGITTMHSILTAFNFSNLLLSSFNSWSWWQTLCLDPPFLCRWWYAGTHGEYHLGPCHTWCCVWYCSDLWTHERAPVYENLWPTGGTASVYICMYHLLNHIPPIPRPPGVCVGYFFRGFLPH